MKITVVGCSGSFPGPTSAASCYLVEADGLLRACSTSATARSAPLQRHLDLRDLDARADQPPAPRPLHRPAARSTSPGPTTRGAHFAPLPVYVPTGGGRAAGPGLRQGRGRRARRVVRLRRVDGGRPQGRAADRDGAADGAPRRDLGDAGRARRQVLAYSGRHRPVRRRWSSWPGTPTWRCSRRPSRTTATTKAPRDLHLTGRRRRAGPRPPPAYAGWCSPTCRRGTTPRSPGGTPRRSTSGSDRAGRARRTTYEL